MTLCNPISYLFEATGFGGCEAASAEQSEGGANVLRRLRDKRLTYKMGDRLGRDRDRGLPRRGESMQFVSGI